MTTEPLPQITELFVKESTGGRPERAGAAPSPVDAKLFERFLGAAGGGRRPGPAPAAPEAGRADRRAPERSDARRDRVDRDRRPDLRDDVRRADVRRDAVERRDQAERGRAERHRADQRADPADDDRAGGDRPDRADRADDRTRNGSDDRGSGQGGQTDGVDGERTEASEEADGGTAAETGGTGETGADGGQGTGTVAGGAIAVEPAPDLPAEAESAALTPAVQPDRIDLSTEPDQGEGEELEITEEAAVEDEGGAGDDADAPVEAPATAVAELATAGAVAETAAPSTGEQAPTDGQASEAAVTPAEVAAVAGRSAVTATDEAADQPVDGATETIRASDGPDRQVEAEPDAGTAPSAPEADPDGAAPVPDSDGAEPITVSAPATSTSGRQTTTNDGAAVTGVDTASAAGPRRGPATVGAPAAAGTGPVVDGEPGDPLWLQVHRAVGSLRTLRNGDQQLTVRLRPAELGSVMVRINAGEHGTVVSLVTDSAVAANQLNHQRQLLIDQLEQSGLQGVAVDVDARGNPDQAQAGDPDGDGGSDTSPGNGGRATIGASAAGDSPNGSRARLRRGSSAGLVDLEL